MKHSKDMTKNEEGSVLLLALALLILLTIAGLGTIRSTNTELRISGNDRCFKQNIYRAESSVVEAAQTLFNNTTPTTSLNPLAGASLSWIHRDDPSLFNPTTDTWTYTGASPNAQRSSHFTDDESGYTVVYSGIAPGAALDLASGTTMRQYEIIGRAEQCDGQVEIMAGYRLRY